MMEVITRKFNPMTQVYTFGKNRSIRIRLVTFHSRAIKSVFVIMDVLHISLACYLSNLANSEPEAVAVCHEALPTAYVLSCIIMALGYLSILRLTYLVFPHLLGSFYFSYRQRKDSQWISGEQKDLNVYNYSLSQFRISYSNDFNFRQCRACNKDY